MSKNPFGGFPRLDKCNLQGPSTIGGEVVDVVSDTPGEITMILETFKDAINNYLFYLIGEQNGTTVEEFFWAAEFLLRVRSDKPETWEGARYMRTVYKDEATGKRITRAVALTDEQLMMSCADRMYDLTRLPELYGPFEDFVAALREQRRLRLSTNWQQVQELVDLTNNRSIVRNILHGETIPLKLLEDDMETVLTEGNQYDLSELIRYQPRSRRIRYRAHAPAPCEHNKTKCARNNERPVPPARGDLLACLENTSPESADSPGHRSARLSA
jgi:hypothetical protein